MAMSGEVMLVLIVGIGVVYYLQQYLHKKSELEEKIMEGLWKFVLIDVRDKNIKKEVIVRVADMRRELISYHEAGGGSHNNSPNLMQYIKDINEYSRNTGMSFRECPDCPYMNCTNGPFRTVPYVIWLYGNFLCDRENEELKTNNQSERKWGVQTMYCVGTAEHNTLRLDRALNRIMEQHNANH